MDWWKIGGTLIGGGVGFWALGPLGLVAAPAGYLIAGAVESKSKESKAKADAAKSTAAGVPAAAPSPFSPPVPLVKSVVMAVQAAVPPQSADVVQRAAMAMNTALTTHGYKKADMPLYMAFQRVAGLSADGYPGRRTIEELSKVLSAAGQPMAQVKIFSWDPSGGYDGTNAPSVQEWIGDTNWQGPPPLLSDVQKAVATAVQNVDAVGKPQASQVAGAMPMGSGSPVSTVQDVQRALNTLGYAKPPLVADGIEGPKTKAAVVAFQRSNGLSADGIAGPNTKAALQNALATPTPAA